MKTAKFENIRKMEKLLREEPVKNNNHSGTYETILEGPKSYLGDNQHGIAQA
jgi:hypothetical protein